MTLSSPKKEIISQFMEGVKRAMTEYSVEKIDHPLHYNTLPAECTECHHPIECIDVVQHMNFNLGNTVKYIWRAGVKNPQTLIEDLEKARWYLDAEIKRLQNEKVNRES